MAQSIVKIVQIVRQENGKTLGNTIQLINIIMAMPLTEYVNNTVRNFLISQ